MNITHTFKVPVSNSGERIDAFLASVTETFKCEDQDKTSQINALTRSSIKTLIKDGLVLLNGNPSSPSKKLAGDEEVTITLPVVEDSEILPEDINIDIIFEDEDIIVVNKASGMTVHSGAGQKSGTLVNALLFHTSNLASVGDNTRPGIVHRIDKDTSGALVIAKTNLAYKKLSSQFKEHTTRRSYMALVWGCPKQEEGTIEISIGRDSVNRKKISTRTRRSRKAITHYKVLRSYPLITLLEITLETGRTHQVRVHLTELGNPILGDETYGRRKTPPIISKPIADMIKRLHGQALHAKTLGFIHPKTGKEVNFKTPLPKEMEDIINQLEEENAQTFPEE
ncbi:MAG: RluA family pseudouridine synthase [Deltaproteobacteria bacterium]|nr:RluA family pseudouridine synthase [Deltaproteobacteria bacterium]